MPQYVEKVGFGVVKKPRLRKFVKLYVIAWDRKRYVMSDNDDGIMASVIDSKNPPLKTPGVLLCLDTLR